MTQPGQPDTAENPANPQLLSDYEQRLYGLNEIEIAWRDRQDALGAHGYILRPRFRRGWTPSWKKPGEEKDPVRAEDSFRHWNRRTIDAIRQSDGHRVCLKVVHPNGFEQRIARMLNPEGELQNHKNHCVPILDFFVDGREGYLVMPLLKRFDDPPFLFVDEVLDFIRQTLEARIVVIVSELAPLIPIVILTQGLSFMHSRNVAHRDCSILNIMMDASELYALGFHPKYSMYAADGVTPANPRNRRDVSGVRYYFTDFGIAADFKDTDKPMLITGSDGQDQDVPELSNTVPYNPFAVDVFILGNLYRKVLIEKYTNLAFLSPLSQAMTRKDPTGRPTADEAIKMFDEIIAGQHDYVLKRKLIPASDGRLKRLLLYVGCISQENFAALRRALSQFRLPLRRTQQKNADH